jgi:hypothetical protein
MDDESVLSQSSPQRDRSSHGQNEAMPILLFISSLVTSFLLWIFFGNWFFLTLSELLAATAGISLGWVAIRRLSTGGIEKISSHGGQDQFTREPTAQRLPGMEGGAGLFVKRAGPLRERVYTLVDRSLSTKTGAAEVQKDTSKDVNFDPKVLEPEYAIGQGLVSQAEFNDFRNTYLAQSELSLGLIIPTLLIAFAIGTNVDQRQRELKMEEFQELEPRAEQFHPDSVSVAVHPDSVKPAHPDSVSVPARRPNKWSVVLVEPSGAKVEEEGTSGELRWGQAVRQGQQRAASDIRGTKVGILTSIVLGSFLCFVLAMERRQKYRIEMKLLLISRWDKQAAADKAAKEAKAKANGTSQENVIRNMLKEELKNLHLEVKPLVVELHRAAEEGPEKKKTSGGEQQEGFL